MEQQYSVRLARSSDLSRILAIERAGFGEWAWDRNLFAEYTRTCGELFLVAEGSTKVMGYCIGRISRGAASIESIAVAPAARGKGAADALLRSLLRRLRPRGVQRVGLMVKAMNFRAQAFYKKYGFRHVRRIPQYYEDGADALLLHLDL